jgi:tetratricopeptide (TPR) repeat protein
VQKYVVAAAGIVLLSAPALAQGPDPARLREAVHLPSVTLMAGIGFNTVDGLVLPGDTQETAAEIAVLEKALTHDASDAARHLRLAELYGKANDKKRADAAGERAVRLYRQQVRARPDDGRPLTGLGLACHQVGKKDEAEAALRRAVRLFGDWSCQVALGRFLIAQALDTAVGRFGDRTQWVQILLTRKPSPEALAQADRQFAEALACYTRAVELAPREPEVWVRRAVARLVFGLFRAVALAPEGKAANAMASLFNEEGLADLQELARLRPDDPKAVGLAALFEILAFVTHNTDKINPDNAILPALPEKTRESVRAKIRRLERLEQGQDARTAAGAAEILGVVCWVALRDPAGTEAHLRRAVALNPDRDPAWDFLAGWLGTAGRHQECLQVCLQRLKHHDSAYGRFLAAKVCEDLGQLDRAEEHVRLGLKQEPEDVRCAVALAALLLKRDDARALEQAGRQLDRVAKLLQTSTVQDSRNDYLITRALYAALTGDAPRARELLRGVLRADKNNEQAQKALAAVGD